MKYLFHKIEPISNSILGKKDKKNVNNLFGQDILDKNLEYKVIKCKNKSSIITCENKAIVFFYNKKYYPTIKFIESEDVKFTTIFVDEGAIGPIQRGANVMAPGIFKYIDKIKGEFVKNSTVVIKLLNNDLLGIGISLINLQDLNKNTTGEAVEVLHHNNDDLYKLY